MEGNLVVHWDPLPPTMLAKLTSSEPVSNIMPTDYAGPESCRKCHQENFTNWAQHPHRWMNALASDASVKGDFSGDAAIDYQGARGIFFREDGGYRMRIEQDGVTHDYQINQTLGSRFFQYYIGRGIDGPPPEGHHYYEQDHVLPFGYWLDRKMWVPIVHVHDELPDEGGRWNPLTPPVDTAEGKYDLIYSHRCNYCHTTFPLGDMMIRSPKLMGRFAPTKLFFSMSDYIADSHPEVWDGSMPTSAVGGQTVSAVIDAVAHFEAPRKAATLGISCEACHLGAKAHAEGKQAKPAFAASADCLLVDSDRDTGRTKENVNWACSRCHNGNRPTYAAGISTWNSTEFADASRGACYSELTCIHCHDPHTATGRKWSKTPDQDDAVCLSCHGQYADAETRASHTHHPSGSAGDRCLNCHMPKINEGMQDAVRTHTIFSPTNVEMIEANHPNACNLCHLDKPIDWTVEHLQRWYGQRFDDSQLAAHYPRRDGPVGVGWLQHEHEPTRLIAVDTLAEANADWALSDMVEILDDEYLLNRQFAQQGLEDMLGLRLEAHGYQFYMTREERREPLRRIREHLLQNVPASNNVEPSTNSVK